MKSLTRLHALSLKFKLVTYVFKTLLEIIMLNKVLAYHTRRTRKYYYIIFYSVLTGRNRNGPRGYCKLHSEIFVHVRGHFR